MVTYFGEKRRVTLGYQGTSAFKLNQDEATNPSQTDGLLRGPRPELVPFGRSPRTEPSTVSTCPPANTTGSLASRQKHPYSLFDRIPLPVRLLSARASP